MESLQNNLPDHVALWAAIAWVVLVVSGAILGYKGKITVYRNYDDLGLAFLLLLAPMLLLGIFAIFLQGKEGLSSVAVGFLVVCESIILAILLVRTWKDNSGVGSFLLAVVTKLSLSILFILNFLNFVTPSGKTASQRASARRGALMWLLVLAPVVFALVREKEGFFNPERTLSRRGI